MNVTLHGHQYALQCDSPECCWHTLRGLGGSNCKYHKELLLTCKLDSPYEFALCNAFSDRPNDDEICDVLSGLESHEVTVGITHYAAIVDSACICRGDTLAVLLAKSQLQNSAALKAMVKHVTLHQL